MSHNKCEVVWGTVQKENPVLGARMQSLLFSAFLLTSCNSGVNLDGDYSTESDADTDADTDTDTDADTDADTDKDTDPDTDPEPTIEDWEGDWTGIFTMNDFGDDWFEGCQGEVELEIDDDGEVEGDGECPYGDTTYDLNFEGTITAEGELEGVMMIEFVYAGLTSLTVEGESDGLENINAEFDGIYEYSDWWNEYAYDISGTIELDRD